MQRIARKSAGELAADMLRRHILSGLVQPGTRLTEQSLAAELGLSRGPVRAALQELAREGLVRQTPYSGWNVAEFDARDVWELYTLRAGLEGMASRLAAGQLTAESGARIQDRFEALVRACTLPPAKANVAEADFEFHKAVVDEARHERLLSLYAVVESQIRFIIVTSDALLTDLRELIAQHEPIARAILSGDAGAAQSAAEAHNLTEGQKLADHVAGRMGTA